MGESYLTKSLISDLVRLGGPKRLACVPRRTAVKGDACNLVGLSARAACR